MKTKVTRFFLAISCLGLSLMGLSCNCSSCPASTDVKIVVWNLWDDSEDFQEMIDAFEKAYPQITVEYIKKDLQENATGYETGYEKELLNAMATSSLPDIFSIHNNWVPKYKDKLYPAPYPYFSGRTDKNYCLNNSVKGDKIVETPLSEADNAEKIAEIGKDGCTPTGCKLTGDRVYPKYESIFVDTVSNDFKDQEGVWGISMYVDTLALYRNKDLFNSKGIQRCPETWIEFTEDVKKITSIRDGRIEVAGAAMGTANNIYRSEDILSLLILQQCGQKYGKNCMVSADRSKMTFNEEITLNGETFSPVERALDYYTQFSDTNNMKDGRYTWGNDTFKNEGYGNAVDAFAGGHVGMIFGYYYNEADIKSKNPDLQYEICKVPQVNDSYRINYPNYWGLGVSKRSERKLEAWAFLEFISRYKTEDGEIAKKYMDASGNPSSIREYVNKYDPYQSQYVFSSQALSARSWYKADAAQADLIFRDMINDKVIKNLSTEQAISNAKRDLDTVLSQYRDRAKSSGFKMYGNSTSK